MRTNWSAQSERIWNFITALPNEDIPAPTLNQAAAGDGQYVSSFSKRISECRARAQRLGGDLVKSRDEWQDGQRRTWYRYQPTL